MGILVRASLGETIDRLNEAFFYDKKLKVSEKKEVAEWIAGRSNMPRSYATLPAPTEKDYKTGFRVFTGEKISSGAGTGHIIGEESLRALILLDEEASRWRRSLETSAVLLHPSCSPGYGCQGRESGNQIRRSGYRTAS